MATLAGRIRRVSALSPREVDHLRALCSSWQVLADLSFSDLLLFLKVRDAEAFEVVAQVRCLTSQTLYPYDMVGIRLTQPEQPIVERAFREGRIWAQDEPVLVDGVAIRMDAVPVRFDGKVIAVITKEGSPATSRRPGRLEEVYLELADRVSQMICAGVFPLPHAPLGEWPRVGEGLFVLDENGRVQWASPNAVSSLRRMGVREVAEGRRLDELGLGETPVEAAMSSLRVLDGELARGDTYVTLRVMPLVEDGRATGALALARDVSEIRQKERLISVRDARIREVHHRVKNNLQTIASLLRLQGRRLNSEEAKAALEESVLRVGSIALVHETLSEQPSEVPDFGEVARRIGSMVAEGLVLPERRVEIKVSGRTGPLSADLATPLAVTITELIHNAVEHAFPDGYSGTIGVDLSREGSEVVAVVWDDGVGLRNMPAKGSRLGLQIVRSLVDELGGRVEITSDGGTRAEVRIPVRRRIGDARRDA